MDYMYYSAGVFEVSELPLLVYNYLILDLAWPTGRPFGPKWAKSQLAHALHKLSLFYCNFRCISFTRRNHPESIWNVTVIFEFI